MHRIGKILVQGITRASERSHIFEIHLVGPELCKRKMCRSKSIMMVPQLHQHEVDAQKAS